METKNSKNQAEQTNTWFDSELFTIGLELTVGKLERSEKKFEIYVKEMIEEIGDGIRPYLKVFYNMVRDLPEIENMGISKEMTPYEEVKAFDITNFDIHNIAQKQLYRVKDCLLSLCLTNHKGILDKWDIEDNLKKAIALSNQYNEDWIQELKIHWWQKSGMVMPTENKADLTNEKVIEAEIEEMMFGWNSKAEMLLREAGYRQELIPLTEEDMEELEDKDSWTLSTIILEHLPYEAPMY